MNERETRLDILLALIKSANNFESLNDEDEFVPMSFTEAIICAQIASEWVASGNVPTDDDWARYDKQITKAIAEAEAETANKH